MITGAADFAGTDRFRVLRRLGQGGMGVVYEALDGEKNVKVALKTLHGHSSGMLARFKREFRALQDVCHPNLVSLGELLEDDGQWFFTMQLVEGVDFLSFARPSEGTPCLASEQALEDTLPAASPLGCDEARLRSALLQLAQGLHALHVAGKIHRDIKPSNVLVDRNGHLVLVDFGLVTEIDSGMSLTGEAIVGTAAYMAPEQAASGPIGPPADWYSVGAMLYQTLVGTVPFSGSALQVMMDKQRLCPPSPRALNPKVPKDLDALCSALLQADPGRRPSGALVLHQLGLRAALPRPVAVASSLTHAAPFVGRRDELDALRLMFEEVREGKALTAIVEGESGVGKSTLVSRFTAAMSEDPEVAILAGRCFEREAVPYKAVDGVIDALAGFMARLRDAEAVTFMPRRAALLTQVFPVLKRIPVMADAPRVSIVDPQELRTRLFEAVRELFVRLAERRRLIVVIDDLQWADADSLALLTELLRPPDQPAMLLLATRRPSDQGSGAWPLPGDVREIKLGRLSESEARELTELLIEREGDKAIGSAATIARESDGHPLFVFELVQHAAIRQGEEMQPLRLEEALWDRASRLEVPARKLLELLAVAGSPLDHDTAAATCGLSPNEIGIHVGVLRVAHLARSGLSHGRNAIEVFHDRVRQAVLMNMEPAKRRAYHADLARVLEATSRADPEVLATHFRAAEDLERAGHYAVVAADRAMGVMAFDQAARLYRLAIGFEKLGASEERALRVKLGDALTNAGRGKDAAEQYLLAVPGASVAEALDLSRKAALQLLITGHVDQGIDTMRSVLSSQGIPYPASPKCALVSIVSDKLWLSMRGLRFKWQDESQVAHQRLARIDACWSAGIGLALTDHVVGMSFQLKGLLLALSTGEPRRVARALAVESAHVSSRGVKGKPRVDRLLDLGREVAEKANDPYAAAAVMACRAHASYFWGQWSTALAQCEEAEAVLRERCVAVHWEITTMRKWIGRSLYFLGRIRDLSARVPAFLESFRECGNLYGETSMRATVAPFVALSADNPEAGHEELNRALGSWSHRGYHVQHYYSLYSRASLFAYQGQPDTAVRVLREEWPALQRSLLLRIELTRCFMHDVRARALVGAAAASPAAKKSLLAQARRDAGQLAKEAAPWAGALAALVRAGISAAELDRDRAVLHLAEAERRLEALDMRLHATAARRQRGRLLGGDEGRALYEAATAWMLSEAIKNPDRMTAMLAPGFEHFQ
ncbi:MAG: AAA family ATPase [Deltaproteobacteria bacterium]|nr:AAA family ATPase [Deltaproteobacteria bacterium]